MPFAALLAATPIFGFLLAPPAPLAAPSPPLTGPVLLDVEAAGDAGAAQPSASQADAQETTDALFMHEVRERARLAKLHRSLGLVTWGATLTSVVAGVIQYRNLYGFFAGRGDNPCVQGDAWLGQGQCYGHPLFHLISSVGAGAFYWTTFSISLMMPDPENASEGDSDYAKNVRLHKLLRWVHVAGMGLQTLSGIFIANPRFLGLDRTNDYGTLQGLATAHLSVGLVTFAALTWAGWIFTF